MADPAGIEQAFLGELFARGRLPPEVVAQLRAHADAPPGTRTARLVHQGLIRADEVPPALRLRAALSDLTETHDRSRPADLLVSRDASAPAAQAPSFEDIPEELRPPGAALRRIGRYVVLGTLGQGAMGIVHRAWDPTLRRQVALKLLLPQAGESADEARRRNERFLREAQAVARLRHPGVVPVFEAGEADGKPFLSMEYVQGESLEARLERGLPSRREVAEIARGVAEALQHAHEQGLVHRDVKPANVLLDPQGRPRLSDFGLALDLTTRSDLSVSGVLVGTPYYLSPEQVQGSRKAIGPRSDVFALGTVLYRALTGSLPFPADTLVRLLQMIEREDPVAPRALDPTLHADLETITLRCMEKDPRRRYQSAGEVAAELGRFLAGEPIEARPADRRERLARWARRNRALAATLLVSGLVVAGLLLLGAIGLAHSVNRIRDERDRAQRALDQTEVAREDAETARANAERESERARAAERAAREAGEREALQNRQKTLLLAQALQEKGERLLEGGRHAEAAALLARRLEIEESPGARGALARCLAALHTVQAAVRPKRAVGAVVLQGNLLVSADEHGGLWALEMTEGAKGLQERWRVPGSPRRGEEPTVLGGDGDVVALGRRDGRVLTWPAGREDGPLATIEAGGRGVAALALSRDGGRMAIGTREAEGGALWDARTGALLARLAADAPLRSLALSRDGAFVAGGDVRGRIHVWRASDGAHLRSFQAHRTWVSALVWSSTALLSAGLDGDVHTWGPDAGGERRGTWAVGHPITSLGLEGDGGRVVAGSLSGRLWLRAPGGDAREHLRFGGRVTSTAFAPGGILVVTDARGDLRITDAAGSSLLDASMRSGVVQAVQRAGTDRVHLVDDRGRYSVCDLASGEVEVDTSHGAGISHVAWSPDGRLEAVAYRDGRVVLAEAGAPDLAAAGLHGAGTPVAGLSFSPDGSLLGVAFEDVVRMWRTADGSLLHELQPPREAGSAVSLGSVAFSPDGLRLATTDAFLGQIDVWALPAGRLAASWEGGFSGAAFSPDGSTLAVASEHDVILWSLGADGRPSGAPRVLAGHAGVVTSIAWSADGVGLASAATDGRVGVWDVLRGKVVAFLCGHEGPVHGIVLDRRRPGIITIGADGQVLSWSNEGAGLGSPLRTASDAPLWDLSASADGDTLVGGSAGGGVSAWAVGERALRQRLGEQPGPVARVAVSRDGRWAAGVTADGDASLWDLRAGAAADLPRSPGRVLSCAFSPDSKVLALGGLPARIQLFDVSTCAPIADHVLQGEEDGVNALGFDDQGGRLAAGGSALVVLDPLSGREVARWPMLGSLLSVRSLEFSSRGVVALWLGKRVNEVGGEETWSSLGLWDPIDGAVAVLTEGQHELNDLGLAPDGRWLAAAGQGVEVWDLERQRLHASLALPGSRIATSVAFCGDRARLATNYEPGSLLLWDLDRLGLCSTPAELVQRVWELTGFRVVGLDAVAVADPFDHEVLRVARGE